MSLFNLVDYEAEFPVEILDPSTGEPIGFTWYVVSSASKVARKAQAQVAAKALAKRMGKKQSTPTESELADMILGQMDKAGDAVAVCVTRWEVDDALVKKHSDDDYTFSPEAVSKFLTMDWLQAQVTEAADDIANFTKT